ncbi:MAG TPA: hypothetical protein VLS49_03690 [Usitatibacter sp.]|nr:hypothetical protein [Usitatibacter sp.]
MCEVALSRPVDFDVLPLALSLLLVPLVALGLVLDAEPLVDALPFNAALPLVEDRVSDEDDAAPLYLDDDVPL